MNTDISKYLFIFEPSAKWRWCGGAIIVIAESFEKASQLLVDDEAIQSMNRTDTKTYKHQSEVTGEGYNCWVLTHQIAVEPMHEPKVLVNNYNYA